MLVFGVFFLVGFVSGTETEDGSNQESILDVYAVNPSFPNHNGFPPPTDVFQRPVIVLAPVTGEGHAGLVAFYADKGLRSVVDYLNFSPLFKMLRKSSRLYGLLLPYQTSSSNMFIQNAVFDLVLPDGFRVFDLLRDVQLQEVPILFVAPKDIFNSLHFVGLNIVYRFVINDSGIEPVPLQVFGSFSPFQPANNVDSSNANRFPYQHPQLRYSLRNTQHSGDGNRPVQQQQQVEQKEEPTNPLKSA